MSQQSTVPTVMGVSAYCWNGYHGDCPIPGKCMCASDSCTHPHNDFFFNKVKPRTPPPRMPYEGEEE